jgi:hypothetical protein
MPIPQQPATDDTLQQLARMEAMRRLWLTLGVMVALGTASAAITLVFLKGKGSLFTPFEAAEAEPASPIRDPADLTSFPTLFEAIQPEDEDGEDRDLAPAPTLFEATESQRAERLAEQLAAAQEPPPLPGPSAQEDPAKELTSPPQAPPSTAPSAAPALSPETIANSLPEIERTLRDFFEARHVEMRLPHVRLPTFVRQLMDDYYSRPQRERWKMVDLIDVRPISDPARPLALAQVSFESHSPRRVLLEHTPEGFKIDWESLVHYESVSWESFLEIRPGKPHTFRLLASRSNYYSGLFINQDSLACLQINHPTSTGVIHAYFERADPALAHLLDVSSEASRPSAVLLSLRFPPGATSSSQAIITSAPGAGWLRIQTE